MKEEIKYYSVNGEDECTLEDIVEANQDDLEMIEIIKEMKVGDKKFFGHGDVIRTR